MRSFERYAAAAELAASLGMGVNAGHDLDLDNLQLFRDLPHLDEVSIGHAIMSRALFVGLATVVAEYLAVLVSGPAVAGFAVRSARADVIVMSRFVATNDRTRQIAAASGILNRPDTLL